jgi:tetratricopeptide (TPR) repeat protein
MPIAHERISRLRDRADRVLEHRAAVLSLFLLAFLLKLSHVLESQGSLQIQVPILDPRYYLETARSIAAGAVIRPEAFFMGPLYSYVLALVMAVAGESLLVIRILQIVGGSVTVVLTYLLGRSLFRPSTAFLGALLLAFYGAATFYEGQFLMMWLGTLLDVALLLALYRAAGRRSAAPYAVAGLLLGLSALARANVLIFLPVAWIGIALAEKKGRRLGRNLVFTAATAIVIAPATLHNAVASGDFVLVTSNAGVNFYIGNYEHATGIFANPRGIDLGRDPTTRKHAEQVLGRDLKPSEVSRYWFSETLRDIQADPLRWAGLLLRKVRLFVDGYEVPQIESYDLSRERYASLRMLPVSYWILLALGAVGVMLTVDRWRRHFLLYGFLVSYSFSIVLFFVTARYRAQIAPVLALYAAHALWTLVAEASVSVRRALVPAAAVVVLLALTRPGLTRDDRAQLEWREDIHRARRLSRVGRSDEAREAIDRAVDLFPHQAESYLQRAIVLKEQGDLEHAIGDYDRALSLDPDAPEVHYDLGQTYRQLDSLEAAVREYRRAIELDSLMVGAWNNLGVTYRGMRDYDRAIRAFRKALRIDPGHERARNNLGSALAESGRPEEAVEVFREAIRRNPDYALSYRNLALAYFQQEKWASGLEPLREYLKREPADVRAQHLLQEVLQVLGGGG